MQARSRITLALALVLAQSMSIGMSMSVTAAPMAPDERQSISKAVAFLSREVPLWPSENQCFSCHNNGDAARALYAARARGMELPAESLRSTSDWLLRPGAWDDNKGEGAFNDETLSDIQFASALLAAIRSGVIDDESALRKAAERVARAQGEDGAWRLDQSASIGSPATYGTALATTAAREVLVASAATELETAVQRADRWLRRVEARTVIDAAAVLLGLAGAVDEAALRQRNRCLEVLEKGRAPSGGWGPYVSSAEEPFDTALVLLALQSSPETSEPLFGDATLAEVIQKGRQFLLDRQLADGSWVETTRPAGQQSYAQYISTTGWVTLALLQTSR